MSHVNVFQFTRPVRTVCSEYKNKYVPGGERYITVNPNDKKLIRMSSAIDHLYQPDIHVKPYLSPSIMRLPELSANHAKRRERIIDPQTYDLIYFDKTQNISRKDSEYKGNYVNHDTNAYRSKRHETYVNRYPSPFITSYSRSESQIRFQ